MINCCIKFLFVNMNRLIIKILFYIKSFTVSVRSMKISKKAQYFHWKAALLKLWFILVIYFAVVVLLQFFHFQFVNELPGFIRLHVVSINSNDKAIGNGGFDFSFIILFVISFQCFSTVAFNHLF